MLVPARPPICAKQGKCVIFTSHRWGEVAISPTGSRSSATASMSATRRQLTEGEAVTLMTGRTDRPMYPERPPLAHDAPVVSRCRFARRQMKGISFALRRGEILGVGGSLGKASATSS